MKDMTDDRRIVMLRHNFKNLPWDDPYYVKQCADVAERIVYDVTSRNPRTDFIRQLSPMFIGPVVTGDGIDAQCFELYWQCSKLYPCHAFMNEPTAEYWEWRKMMFSKGVDEAGTNDKRHPNRKLKMKPRDCMYSVWYNRATGRYEHLGYIESRKRCYIVEYARLIAGTEAIREMKEAYDAGKKIAIVDFDAYNYYNENKTIRDVINEYRPAGHGYVVKMLLEGDISVVDGEVVDNIGILDR